METKLYAYISYPDAPAALDWLQAVGIEVVRRQDSPDGRVLHSEIHMGEALLMVSSNDADYLLPPLMGRSTGQGLYLFVDDVDAFHRKALAAGGISVIEPEDTEWGSRRCRMLDPQGKEWSAGTYQPGIAW